MPDQVVKILFIDDDEDDFILARDLLSEIPGAAFEIDWVQDYHDALALLAPDAAEPADTSPAAPAYDACLVDFRLGEKDGISLIREAKQRGRYAASIPIILLTGQGDHAIDLAAMNAGAADFLDKSQLTAGLLERALRYAIHSSKVETQRARLLAVAEQQAAQLRHLAAELTQAEQRERRRVAQTLHDHLQQLLVAAKMRVDRLLARDNTDEKLSKAVAQVHDLITESIEASRSLTVQLSPPVLHDRGLIPALEWLSRQFAKEHDLSVDVVADEPLEVGDDHVRDFLFQAVRELLFNVVKHAQANQAVITVARDGDASIQVSVRDDGRGCDPSLLAAGRSGAGFGLFHLQQRIEFLGGRFVTRSEPGNGCEITLVAPVQVTRSVPGEEPDAADDDTPAAADPAAASPQADAAATPPSERISVLLVDDHKILREGLATLLRDQPGIEVVGEARDGQMAVELCQQLQPDVVVMDVSMPGMSGIEATRVIRRECANTQVIGLSMHEEADMAAAMRTAGAAVYLPKDGPSEELIAAIFQQASHAPPSLTGPRVQ